MYSRSLLRNVVTCFRTRRGRFSPLASDRYIFSFMNNAYFYRELLASLFVQTHVASRIVVYAPRISRSLRRKGQTERKSVKPETMQSDSFIDTFYRPFSHEKSSLRWSCKKFLCCNEFPQSPHSLRVTVYQTYLLVLFFRHIYLLTVSDTVYYPCVTCTLLLFLLDLVETIKTYSIRIHNNNINNNIKIESTRQRAFLNI